MSVYTLSLIYSSLMGAPYVATRKKRIEEILKEAGLKKGKIFVEVGCGDGRIVRTAVKKYQVKGVGIDINPLLIIWARLLSHSRLDRESDSRLRGNDNKLDIIFKVENIFDTDLRKADYVYLFLMPKLIEKLALKINKELRKGTIVISHGFPIKRWKKKLFKTLERTPFPTYYYRV